MCYVFCVCLPIVVSNTFCVVFLFCLSSSCVNVPNVASFSELFNFDCPFGFFNVYLPSAIFEHNITEQSHWLTLLSLYSVKCINVTLYIYRLKIQFPSVSAHNDSDHNKIGFHKNEPLKYRLFNYFNLNGFEKKTIFCFTNFIWSCYAVLTYLVMWFITLHQWRNG